MSGRWTVDAAGAEEPRRETAGHCTPSLPQMVFAIDLCRLLNRHVAEGGRWRVAWTDSLADGSPTRLAYGWIDRDGDMPFTVETDEGIAILTRVGAAHYAGQGADALAEYREHLRASEVGPKQMVRFAMGEPVRDPRQRVPADFG